MNAVEIEEAISKLAEHPFDEAEFPYAFLQAFGNKETTLRRLRKGESNKSDVGGVLQTNNIHIACAPKGAVPETLAVLRSSAATGRAKAKMILATDGIVFEAEDLLSGDLAADTYERLPDHFGFFLPLAGITTVKQIRENAFDIRATSRLNRLYLELLKDNPEWGKADKRPAMNHFMARLIFCFFAEDTDIFSGSGLFTDTVDRMGARDASDLHDVIAAIFRAMNTKIQDRARVKTPRWADAFPYVNGGLFAGSSDVPRFSRIARSYFLHIGGLDWKRINPDIFGSMIQAVSDEDERGALGMHYTSVPNILKVLNPLFLDDIRAKLAEAGDNARMLLNLRKRMAKLRVFDPACGSGNFLVIAYKEMRAIEAEINRRRGETDRRTELPLTNYRGIELRDFPAEVARLALIIAEYQCDVVYRGQKEALLEFLPLAAENWIVCGNALRLDWLSICPPTGSAVKHRSEDLFSTPLDQVQIDFENEGGETYICGNPQFKGARKQSPEQKYDLSLLFESHKDFQDCDYVVGWYLKAARYIENCEGAFAFVSTSSISEGEQVAHLWSRIYGLGCHISFAHRGFKWRNNAANNAVVQCVIVGVGRGATARRIIFEAETQRDVDSISPYLVQGPESFVGTRTEPLCHEVGMMVSGSMPRDGGNLILSSDEAANLMVRHPEAAHLVKSFLGSQELIHVRDRRCLWIEDGDLELAMSVPPIMERIEAVRTFRSKSTAKTTKGYASIPHKFAQRAHRNDRAITIAKVSSEEREFIQADLVTGDVVVSDLAFVIHRAATWELAILLSRLHMAWARTICGKLESRLRYSSTLGWNTFPVPALTEKNKLDLVRSAEDILLAREANFPATLAELYDAETMPEDLRKAHDRNDEVLERIYVGRRFRNDTERLEKLFELYTKTTSSPSEGTKRKREARA